VRRAEPALPLRPMPSPQTTEGSLTL
jgi:hypothetical protein